MPGLQRRFNYMPDAATLAELPGVIIVSIPPVGDIVEGEGGVVCMVGECEDGGFAVDSTVAADVYHPKGGLQDILNGNQTDVAGGFGFIFNGQKAKFPCARRSLGEYWNGNIFVQSKGLTFRRFLIARVDTSVGSVTFSPLAFQESGTAGPWALTTGQTLVVAIDGAADATATFTGTQGVRTGTGATFNTLTAGEYVEISINSGATVRATFQSGDTTIAAVVARINGAFGSTVASNAAGQLALTSPTGGTGSRVTVVGGSSGTLTKLGHTAGTTSGTGNVANIGAVTKEEVKTIVEAVSGTPKVRFTSTGKVRVCSPTGVTGTLNVRSSGTATAFAFTTESAATATSGATATSIPAGTVCSDGTAAKRVVTMQTLKVPALTQIGITVKVRPAEDDGTYAGASAAAINTIETTPSATAEWIVTNPAALTVALTEAQKDAAYENALAVTKGLSSPQKLISYVVSARQSHRARLALRQNAIDASGRGSYGRKAPISPPLGTSLASMITSSDPGVGTYRAERAWYCTGWKKFIQEIAEVGASLGGAGFTDDGIVEVHGDIVVASLSSVLPPEESIAQDTDILPEDLYVGVESAIANWGPDEYALAKKNGICAGVWDEDEGLGILEEVTSVDPATYPGQVYQSRLKLDDHLTDSVAAFQKKYVSKRGTDATKEMLLTKLHDFLQGLKDAERIKVFVVTEGTSPLKRAHVIKWQVEGFEPMSNIINSVTVGPGATAGSQQGA